VRKISLDQIAKAMGGTVSVSSPDCVVSRVGIDTRNLAGRDMFFALKGPRYDGHAFLCDALRAGVKAAVVNARNHLAYEFRAKNPGFPVVLVKDTTKALEDLAAFVREGLNVNAVSITGTTGKTCTKDFLVSILLEDRSVCASEDNQNNEIGVPLTIFRANKKDSALVTELGARHPGDIKRLVEIVKPGAGIITNVGPGHLKLFKTMEIVAETKAELAVGLPEDGDLFLNAGDPSSVDIARKTRARVTRFGRGRGAAYRVDKVRVGERGKCAFELCGPGFRIDVSLPLVGRHQVQNALAAAACAHVLGSKPQAIKKGLQGASIARMRTECVECADGYLVINDAYNANPPSMESALRTIGDVGGARRTIAVLGGMAELGPSSREFHVEVGRKAAELDVDLLVAVGKMARPIASGAVEGGMPKGSVFRCDDVMEALDTLKCIVEPRDVILVKASRVFGLESISNQLTSRAFIRDKLAANV